MSGPSGKSILVIGGAGYIGSVLTGRLLDAGYPVRVLDSLLYNNEAALALYRDVTSFEFVKGDFRDAATLESALEGAASVVMLAALVGDPLCKKHPELAVEINQTGTLKLVDSLSGRGIDRLVFMSTCSNYGLRETDDAATEGSPLNPKSLYAETKVRVEQYLLDHANRFDFAPIILRCATAYGQSPRLRLDLTVNDFTYEVAMGHDLLVYDADTWRPYCHVEDISDAIITALQAPDHLVVGEVFNVGRSGENYTKRMLVDILKGLAPEAVVHYREGSVDPRNYRVSFEKITGLLHFSGHQNVSRTIQQLLTLFRGTHPPLVREGNSFHNNILE